MAVRSLYRCMQPQYAEHPPSGADNHAQAAAASVCSLTPAQPLPLSPASAMDPFAPHSAGEAIASGDAGAALIAPCVHRHSDTTRRLKRPAQLKLAPEYL
jgi:hypothetical protein